jgi:mTERF domain-containing protein
VVGCGGEHSLTRAPMQLRRSKHMLECRSQFLISEVGLEAHRAAIICLSLEGRLKPRHYVPKFLKEHEILDHDWSFSSASHEDQ